LNGVRLGVWQTNPNFLQTIVYANVKTFYSSLLEIFEEGRESGEMWKAFKAESREIKIGDHMKVLQQLYISILDAKADGYAADAGAAIQLTK